MIVYQSILCIDEGVAASVNVMGSDDSCQDTQLTGNETENGDTSSVDDSEGVVAF